MRRVEQQQRPRHVVGVNDVQHPISEDPLLVLRSDEVSGGVVGVPEVGGVVAGGLQAALRVEIVPAEVIMCFRVSETTTR